MARKKEEGIAWLVAVLSARTSPIARDRGRKEEISGARLFSSRLERGNGIARHLFPKAEDFWSTNSPWTVATKVLRPREQRQYLCRG